MFLLKIPATESKKLKFLLNKFLSKIFSQNLTDDLLFSSGLVKRQTI